MIQFSAIIDFMTDLLIMGVGKYEKMGKPTFNNVSYEISDPRSKIIV